MGIGILMVRYSESMLRFFGRNWWAERKLGSSRLFYKLLGVGVSIIGVFIATNIISDIMQSFAGIFVR